MDVQGVAAGAPQMNPAAQAKQASQAQEQEQRMQVAKAETPKQDAQGGTAPGVGQNINITV